MIKVLRLFNDERLSPQSYCKCVYQPGEDSSIYMYVCALPSKISPVLKRERARSHTTHILNCKSVVLLRYFFFYAKVGAALAVIVTESVIRFLISTIGANVSSQ